MMKTLQVGLGETLRKFSVTISNVNPKLMVCFQTSKLKY